MQYKGYLGKVEFDPEAKILHGEVIGIRDVVTFESDSPKDVEQAFRDSVDDYLAFCKARGERPEKPYSGTFLLRVAPSLHHRLSALAKAEGKSLNALVAEYLERDVEKAWSLAQVQTKSKQGPHRSAAPSKGRPRVRAGAERTRHDGKAAVAG